jgi:hypothetical protein
VVDALFLMSAIIQLWGRRPSLDLAIRARRPAHHNAECKRPAWMDSNHLHDIESVGPSQKVLNGDGAVVSYLNNIRSIETI